jgi:glutamate/tyrosine decarboxylase-like PLP-dependent enzyme
MHYLGVEGYRAKAKLVTDTRERIARGVAALGLRVLGDPQLGIVAYGADDADIFAVWGRLARRGWMTALTTSPRAIHLMLSPAHAQVADAYLADLEQALAEVRKSGESGSQVRARYA